MSDSSKGETINQHSMDKIEKIIDVLDGGDSMYIPSTMTAVLQKKNKRKFNDNFQSIGLLNNYRRNKSTVDILDALEEVPKAALKVLNHLKYYRDENTNMCIVDKPFESKGEEVVFGRLIQSLRKAHLVKRVPAKVHPTVKDKLIFMLNPSFIFCWERDTAKTKCSEIK